ncbi:ATPase [Curtobacterium sp. 'Ferrero']|uniref:GIY-YIG nuclease family protein n=1 Tax=Curtobacterium sp. 'Ferrero' TaxID=2033654 RepID=UPI000BC58A77|nr:GIY-YIG nuclease family protein [Curtobacterium sp. 'Ferrero']PCN46562.1 ATPase [Curtobacterium sp. 'Ferrero']
MGTGPDTHADVCCAPGCDTAPVHPDDPVPLCGVHASTVVDRATGSGVEDLLPGPCAMCSSPVGVRYPDGAVCAVCEWRWGDVPDGDLAPPRVDVVYYLRMRDNTGDRVKIGTTANPRQRLAAIAHQDLMAFERGDRSLERRRHRQFAATRYPGTEWFRTTPELLAHIEVVCGGVVDPWDVHARWVSAAWALRG